MMVKINAVRDYEFKAVFVENFYSDIVNKWAIQINDAGHYETDGTFSPIFLNKFSFFHVLRLSKFNSITEKSVIEPEIRRYDDTYNYYYESIKDAEEAIEAMYKALESEFKGEENELQSRMNFHFPITDARKSNIKSDEFECWECGAVQPITKRLEDGTCGC